MPSLPAGYRKETSLLTRLALPVIGTQLANVALSTTDVLMAGWLSASDLGAIAVGSAVGNPVIYTAMGVLVAVTPIVAQLFGAENHLAIGEKVRQGLWTALLLAVPGVIFMRSASGILVFIGIEAELIPITVDYLNALSWGLPFFLFFFVLRFFNDGISRTGPAFIISLASLPVNFLANYLLMYGKLGFPRLGAQGCGYATSVVWFFMFATMAGWVFLRSEYKDYLLIKFSLPRRTVLAEIFSIGIPNGVSIFLEISMFATITLFIGSLSVEVVAAHQITINIASIAYMIPLGIAIALTSRVGQAVGRGSRPDIVRSAVCGMTLSGVICLLLALVFFTLPNQLVSLYTDDPGVSGIAAGLLFFAALFQFSDGIQIACVGALRGLKDTKIPMLLNILAFWILGLPAGYLAGMVFELGAKGFWMGLVFGLTAGAVFQFGRLIYLVGLGRGVTRLKDSVF